MTPEEAKQLYNSSEVVIVRLLKIWVVYALFSASCEFHVPYSIELRAVFSVIACVSLLSNGGSARSAVNYVFDKTAPPILGTYIPKAARWFKKQIRGSLQFVSPATRQLAVALLPPSNFRMLSDADLTQLHATLLACRDAVNGQEASSNPTQHADSDILTEVFGRHSLPRPALGEQLLGYRARSLQRDSGQARMIEPTGDTTSTMSGEASISSSIPSDHRNRALRLSRQDPHTTKLPLSPPESPMLTSMNGRL